MNELTLFLISTCMMLTTMVLYVGVLKFMGFM